MPVSVLLDSSVRATWALQKVDSNKMYSFVSLSLSLKKDLFIYVYGYSVYIGIQGTTVIDSCELPCWYGESNSRPLGEHPVLLTTDPSLWPLHIPL